MQDRLYRAAEDLDTPHPAVARRRRGMLVDARRRESHEDDLVLQPLGVEGAVQDVDQRDDAERPAAAWIGGGAEEVDEHGVPLGDGYGAARGVEGPARTGRVDDLLTPRVPRHDRQGEARDLLLADPEHQRQAAHHTVPGRRHVHDTLVETGVPNGGSGPDEPFELLCDAGVRVEGPRPLGDHRGDDVVGPQERHRQLVVSGAGVVEEHGQPDQPGRGFAHGFQRARVQRSGPRRHRSVARPETLRAALVDAHDHRRGRRPGRPGEQEEVDGPRARGREHVEEERGGEHDGDRDREEAGPEEAPLEGAPRGCTSRWRARRHATGRAA